MRFGPGCLCGNISVSHTKKKLPYVNEKLYNHLNEGAVCAFDHKGGSIKTFESKEEANLENYQVVLCDFCGHCSTRIDLELQWSTRKTLAIQSQKCAIQSLLGGVDDLQQCLEWDMIGGMHRFTTDCARMTNQVGNFKVGPDSITSATCKEANFKPGNTGEFVYCVGANRRRMNITSGIARPSAQQCEIVDVESWDEIFPRQS